MIPRLTDAFQLLGEWYVLVFVHDHEHNSARAKWIEIEA